MTPDVDEALLSAYLDGEATDEERLLVEQRLTDDAAWRQLYDELLTLRKAFAALERHKLSADFSSHVLREAERVANAAKQSDALRVAPASDRPTIRLRWPRHWRAYAWPALAAAAALFMTLYHPETERRKIAQAPPRSSLFEHAEIGAAPALRSAAPTSDQTARRALLDEAAAPQDATAADSPAAPIAAAGARAEMTAQPSEPLKTLAEPSDAAMPARFGNGAPAESQSLARDAAPRMDQQSAADARRAATDGAANLAPAAKPANAPMAPSADALVEQESASGSPSFKREAATGSMTQRKAGAVQRARTPASSPLDRPLEGVPVGGERQLLSAAAREILVVELVTRQDVNGQNVLQQLLARHGISAPSADRETDAKGTRSDEKTGLKPAAGDAKSIESNNADEMRILATRQQIEAALADLRDHDEDFVSMNVQPTAGSILLQPLAAYSRNGLASKDSLAQKKDKSKMGRAAESRAVGAGGGLGGLIDETAAGQTSKLGDAAPSKKGQEENSIAKQQPAAAAAPAPPAQQPVAADHVGNDSVARRGAEVGKELREGEDKSAPMLAVFLLRTVESPPPAMRPIK